MVWGCGQELQTQHQVEAQHQEISTEKQRNTSLTSFPLVSGEGLYSWENFLPHFHDHLTTITRYCMYLQQLLASNFNLVLSLRQHEQVVQLRGYPPDHCSLSSDPVLPIPIDLHFPFHAH